LLNRLASYGVKKIGQKSGRRDVSPKGEDVKKLVKRSNETNNEQ